MLFAESKLLVIDNCGAKSVKCIKVLGKKTSLGSIILVTIKKRLLLNSNNIFNKKIYFGLVTHLKYPSYRLDGLYLSFKKNCLILLTNNFKVLGSRILKPLVKELSHKFKKLLVKAKVIF